MNFLAEIKGIINACSDASLSSGIKGDLNGLDILARIMFNTGSAQVHECKEH